MTELMLWKQRQQLIKWLCLSILAAFLVALGNLESFIKEETTLLISRLPGVVMMEDQNLLHLFERNIERITNLTYRLIYCGTCLLIIHVLYLKPTFTNLALWLYFLLIVLTILFYAAAELMGVPPLRIVAFRIDSLAVSPMPAALLVSATHLLTSLKQKM